MLTGRNNRDAGQPWRPGRIRTALALGVVLGTGAVGVHAYWNDTATLTTGSFESGTLDLTLDGELDGQGGLYTKTAISMSSMLPGESLASAIIVANGERLPFTYTATGTATGDLAAALQFEVFVDATAGNTGTLADIDRAGTCTGGTSLFGPDVLDGTPASVVNTPRELDFEEDETLCIVVSLPLDTDPGLAGTTATASLEFTANQLVP